MQLFELVFSLKNGATVSGLFNKSENANKVANEFYEMFMGDDEVDTKYVCFVDDFQQLITVIHSEVSAFAVIPSNSKAEIEGFKMAEKILSDLRFQDLQQKLHAEYQQSILDAKTANQN